MRSNFKFVLGVILGVVIGYFISVTVSWVIDRRQATSSAEQAGSNRTAVIYQPQDNTPKVLRLVVRRKDNIEYESIKRDEFNQYVVGVDEWVITIHGNTYQCRPE